MIRAPAFGLCRKPSYDDMLREYEDNVLSLEEKLFEIAVDVKKHRELVADYNEIFSIKMKSSLMIYQDGRSNYGRMGIQIKSN